MEAAVFAGIERDLVKKYRSLYPAQKQAVQVHMDQHFDPFREDSEVHFNELLKNALDAEMPFFSRRERAFNLSPSPLWPEIYFLECEK